MNVIKTKPYTPTDIKVDKISDTKVKITAYPFEAGYAITLAHPIRRLLLSSSIGYAPVGLKIEGVSHEFDSIRGIVEDVSPFMINLKNVRYSIKDKKGNEDEIVLNYSFKGPMTLRGSDLVNNNVDVVNKDVYLATINENASLTFSIIVRKGIGYVPSENIRSIIPAGYMPLDAFFTPVKKVVYDIENVLVEDNPSFEKIIFDIETDGQISPLDAFKNAFMVMGEQMSIFGVDLNVAHTTNGSLGEDSGEIKTLMIRLDTLGLSARCINALSAEGLEYVGEVVMMNDGNIKAIKNMGAKSFEELAKKLADLGYPVDVEIGDELVATLKRKFAKIKK